jgi:MarR family transcriptional regulator for hemolysin
MSMNTTPLTIVREIYETSRVVKRHFDRRARNHGFTQGQWRALWHLERNEGITQASLAEILEMQPIAVARVLGKMEKAGLITRQADPGDKRAIKLYITPRAAPTLKLLHDIADDVRALASQGLTQEEQANIVSLMHRIKANFASVDAKAAHNNPDTVQDHTNRQSP